MTGTRVTCEDLETGETESTIIRDDFVVITDGRMELAYVNEFPTTGTVQITLKRKKTP